VSQYSTKIQHRAAIQLSLNQTRTNEFGRYSKATFHNAQKHYITFIPFV